MLLSPEQQRRFWREWSAVKKTQDWNPVVAETKRHEMLTSLGFDSLTQVDRVQGFTRVLHELAALKANLAGMVQTTPEANARRVLNHAIEKYGRQLTTSVVNSAPWKNPYIAEVMADRWHHADPSRLTLTDLEHLRNTLAARATAKRRRPAAVSAEDQPQRAAVEADCPF